MTVEDIRNYCLSLRGVTEEFPFDNDTLVFKVYGKVFLLTGLSQPQLKVNLKCDPERAVELRDQYDFVLPGYHMNKKHWNTVIYNGRNGKLLKELIDHSYDLVLKGIPKSKITS